MITSQRMAAVDANAEALGVPRKQLMESSGNAIARVVRQLADPGDAVAVVCGRGNNGGDALVAARFLERYEMTVHLLGRPETITTEITRENWEAIVAAELDATVVRDSRTFDPGEPDLVVDAILGTGATGALREPERSVVDHLGDLDAPILSVDVPTGIDPDTGDRLGGGDGIAIDADHVVTFHDRKPGLESLDADVTVADIGIPRAAELFTGPGDLLQLDRRPDSHKGENGEVLVVGGGPYTGAPTLAASAALRAGADLVRVACPELVAREVQAFSPDLIVRPFSGETLAPAHVEQIAQLAADHDAVVFGPGLGDAEATLEAVHAFLDQFEGRAVIDADVLEVVPDVDTDATLVCTPHQGELRGMGGPGADDWETRADLVSEFAAELGHVLLVKGQYDVVTDGENVRINRTGNPGMTVGGTGDVLAGAVGALLSVLPPFEAGAVGAFANGRAGDSAYDDAGNGLVATDLIDRLPEALRTDE
ncbi:NAD(P)H-hydrate repair enzyme Nnr, NAD(P)H-hydrate dehydratase domain [Halalkaliarchaeum sp. AArc-CO]|uniref:NAD(P)H-hydrate dehydratase n=1 Tax=Halalkaliarchaeum sp. AArc-CO TaxID=2866381 RepID=UPI00217DBBE5|nr:NAD(P)H-hydrate dehydratase [Halalkaliarchaeum sp. AArc-CO]UWG50855.1 NAD(P)H-hydrate repair enzyme Nnr, NAD(P)H-hydrate dehydratase domain [Halalkaliarchaeum sp. AArc-CO]